MDKKIPFGSAVIGQEEIEQASKVLRSGWLAEGPNVEQFEKKFSNYIGTKYAVAVSSCTAALHISMMALGIKPGDEVIVPAQTHVATAHCVLYVGANPIFADIDPKTYNIDPKSIEDKVTDKTKAINLVHFAGLPCEMDEILDIAKEHDLKVVEDCAHALGAKFRDKTVGSLGDTGCFSFYPIKQITTCEGGMLVTNDELIAKKGRLLRSFGIDRSAWKRSKTGVYDVPVLGYNYRMTDVEAAIGLAQLRRVESLNKKRIRNAALLTKLLRGLKGVIAPHVPDYMRHTYFFYQLRLTEDSQISRDQLIEELKKNGIQSSIYYATPVHLMSLYRKKFGYKEGDLPESEKVAVETIALPVHPLVGEDDIRRMAEIIRGCVSGS
jgi:dTDP-4-amino-4,6-dideoxygalactose transaminase